MPTAAQQLARFAADLKLADIPAAVVARTKDCIIDATAAASFGAQLPWGKMAASYAQRYGAGGNCTLIGVPQIRVHTPYAALANGVFAHAFEQDSVRDPGIGAHPGAALMPALLAACEETGADGATAISAFVAGCEVMFRIGSASHHSKVSPEKLGFHAPGLTGPYGSAIATARVFGLNAEQMSNALGIAGSLSSGLLAFTKSKSGAMIKRLHLGRAAESGILAARLAASGYTGPETILEGKFGFLDAYCKEGDPALLTEALGERWETLRICIKRYSCHMRAQISIQAVRELLSENSIAGSAVKKVIIEGSDKLLSHHNIPEPNDVMQSQYSVPFCVALALIRDPEDPNSFGEQALNDATVRTACRTVELRARTGHPEKSAHITLELKDGRKLEREATSYKGMPDNPLNRTELHRKFMLLTSGAIEKSQAEQLFEHLEHLETQPQILPTAKQR